MVCPFCQAELSVGDKVCPMCGAPVNEAPVKKPEIDMSMDYEPIVETVDPGKKLGVAGMAMGIVSLVAGLFSCCCCGGIYGIAIFFVTSIISLILSIVASKKSKEAGFVNKNATVGIIVSAITAGVLLIGVVIYIIYIVLYGVAGMAGMLEELINY